MKKKLEKIKAKIEEQPNSWFFNAYAIWMVEKILELIEVNSRQLKLLDSYKDEVSELRKENERLRNKNNQLIEQMGTKFESDEF